MYLCKYNMVPFCIGITYIYSKHLYIYIHVKAGALNLIQNTISYLLIKLDAKNGCACICFRQKIKF